MEIKEDARISNNMQKDEPASIKYTHTHTHTYTQVPRDHSVLTRLEHNGIILLACKLLGKNDLSDRKKTHLNRGK